LSDRFSRRPAYDASKSSCDAAARSHTRFERDRQRESDNSRSSRTSQSSSVPAAAETQASGFLTDPSADAIPKASTGKEIDHNLGVLDSRAPSTFLDVVNKSYAAQMQHGEAVSFPSETVNMEFNTQLASPPCLLGLSILHKGAKLLVSKEPSDKRIKEAAAELLSLYQTKRYAAFLCTELRTRRQVLRLLRQTVRHSALYVRPLCSLLALR
jgi:hypothetical protein